MTAGLLAVAGVLLALVAAIGAWWYARMRGLVPARAKGYGAAGEAPATKRAADDVPARTDDMNVGDSDLEDDDFGYAPELRRRPAAIDDAAFRHALEWQHLRREVERLQDRCAEQDGVIAALRAEVEDLRERLNSHLAPAATPAHRSLAVSPEYDAALAYARQGLDAAAIAERCGITLAEAQLVSAMADR